ncbi:NAD-dependent protein deacylase [Selenomonas sp. oral taxon 138]|uniref:NAD-dependent protein deacylase n=1 Tax=Selenomonas sp. oral taxon 138 TaxID=712532 RepID=UPI0002A34FA2|nr:NAD-dependent protein deacylase [Selenomonas sp. oral taxon 138]EKX95869.1 putative NAD-dependent deacetylase [Selenomonas sp. oral taxon 138 str. F0429]
MDKIARLREILTESRRAVFFGGAGMSTESGIPDFRSAGGIYSETLHREFSPEQMASHSFLMAHPAEFFDFYRRRFVYLAAEPNPGHYALAQLERQGHLAAVVTQNIDGLHQAAGSKIVYELHGSIRRAHCTDCGAHYELDYILHHRPIPHCSCGGIVRPDVVLYEESLDTATIEGAVAAIRAADTLIIGGTSLVVYPAAGLIDYFRSAHLILINRTETRADSRAELVIREPIGDVLHAALPQHD